ncbi:Histone acetyltransferase type B catalytic subunit, partial [Fragariocoptes setiger]
MSSTSQENTSVPNSSEEPGSSQSDFTEFTTDGNFAVYFKLIRSQQDIEDDFKKGAFYPDFVHQFFGEAEKIFGYKKPVLKMFYTASRLKRFINFEYEDKLTLEKHGIEPDNVMNAIEQMLEITEYTSNINQFSRDLESKEEIEFRPSGTLLHTFEVNFRPPSMLSRAQVSHVSDFLMVV